MSRLKFLQLVTLKELSDQKTWLSDGYFKNQVTDYDMQKVNYSENSILYINQAFLTVKRLRRCLQGLLHLRVSYRSRYRSSDIDSYQRKENEVEMYCAKYKFSTGQFLGLHETVGLIVVTGDDDEVFFNYGYDKVNSELLYSYQK